MVKNAAKVAALRVESAGLTSAAAEKARAAAEAAAASSLLQLPSETSSEELEKLVARALKAENPALQHSEDPNTSASGLASAFLAYAADLAQPNSVQAWCKLLAEVLSDAGVCLNEDEDRTDTSEMEAISLVVAAFCKKGVLVAPKAKIEEGALVMAVLVEDDDWHEAVIQKELSPDKFLLVFLEYGKPQETLVNQIRPMDLMVDDEGAEASLEEGRCELCARRKLLTFHHLIPKDVHPTYLKKRLPPGIDGEPSRNFLNSYGTMVCRQCHAYIHRIAPNDVLAKEYNTLQKIMDHPQVQKWVQWVSQQSSGR